MPVFPHIEMNSRYVQSWIENREVQSEKANLTILFERYVPVLIDAHRTGKFKMITPVQEVHSRGIILLYFSWEFFVLGEYDPDTVLPAGDPADPREHTTRHS